MLKKHKIFHLFGLSLQKFMENLCTTQPAVIAFMVRDFMALTGIFSIFPLAGLIKLMVYLQICHWISKQVFYRTEILFFVLIPRCGCFGVTYVSSSVELNLFPSESYWCIRVWDVLSLSSCQRHFLKALNGLLILSKKQTWMFHPCINDFRETRSC